MPELKARTFKGTRDFLPADMRIREQIIETLKELFRTFGFAPIETPAFEFLDILAGKYGDDADKLLYPLKYKGGDVLALRYDLTVPLARVMAMNPHLPKPFKRFQIQPVWRADNPQLKRGRFREFYQCDIDTVGSNEIFADAEIVSLLCTAFKKLEFNDAGVKINNRKILRGMIIDSGLGRDAEQEVCRSIDKLDKIGIENVKAELLDKGYSAESVDKLLETFSQDNIWHNGINSLKKLDGCDDLIEGRNELIELFSQLEESGFSAENGDFTFDRTLARGLDYYTGPIFEVVLREHPEVGSVAGGGRYDDLVGLFLKESMPATGVSFGLERIYTLMQNREVTEIGSDLDCLVCYFDESTRKPSLSLLKSLREAGLRSEMYFKPNKLKKQFNYANKKNIPLVLLIGPDELEGGMVKVKNMSAGTESIISITEAQKENSKAVRDMI